MQPCSRRAAVLLSLRAIVPCRPFRRAVPPPCRRAAVRQCRDADVRCRRAAALCGHACRPATTEIRPSGGEQPPGICVGQTPAARSLRRCTEGGSGGPWRRPSARRRGWSARTCTANAWRASAARLRGGTSGSVAHQDSETAARLLHGGLWSSPRRRCAVRARYASSRETQLWPTSPNCSAAPREVISLRFILANVHLQRNTDCAKHQDI